MVWLYNGVLLSNKKDLTADTYNNIDESQKHYAKWKNPDSIGYIMYNSIYMVFAKSK